MIKNNMESIDKKYLSAQYWLKVHQKSSTEFQSYFEDIMQKAFPDFQKIWPYGNQGDGGNDGYIPTEGIYYQVYAPINPNEKEAAAAKKLKKDFERLKKEWNQISKIKKYYFVFNDKERGSSIEIERALAELKANNNEIDFDKFIPKDLEDIFFKLESDQIQALGFDIDSRNTLRNIREYLNNLKIDLDRENGSFVLSALGKIKDIILNLRDEEILVDYEILECRALQKIEKVKEAKEKYKNLCTRYPKDPRAFLYLAEIYLNIENFGKNEELLNQAENIDNSYWLLVLEKLIREQRLRHKIDTLNIKEDTFPTEPRIKSNFYRVYSLFLVQAGEQTKAESFIERAISLNPERYANYDTKLLILENRVFLQIKDKEKFKKEAAEFLSEIDTVEQKISECGNVSPRNKLNFNFAKIRVYITQENFYEIEKLVQESFNLIMQCNFDLWIEKLLSELMMFSELPPQAIERLLHYLKGAEKQISDDLSKAVILQCNFNNNLLTEGKIFFEAIKSNKFINFIDNLENKRYDDVCAFLKEDLRFAVAMANTFKGFPDLRRKIIETLPNDGSIQKEQLLFLLNYDEKNVNEAFDLIKGFDLSTLNYFECKPILKVAQEKKAWEFVVKILEKLLQYEKDEQIILQQELHLFKANLELERYTEVIEIGEKILSNSNKIKLLDEHNREALLGQILLTRLKRGEYLSAKNFLEKHIEFSKSSAFKIGVETEVYLKNNDAYKAIASIVDGVKINKTPTQEQYGSLYWLFTQIGNMIDFPLVSDDKVNVNHFVKIKEQERWYFIGDGNALDATRITINDKKYTKYLGKKIGEKIIFDEKYRSTQTEYTIENILSIEKYILWKSLHYFQQLSFEHRWEVETIEVPKKGETIDTKYIVARLEDERKKRGAFLDLYCKENNVPLAFLAVNEGGLFNAIGCIVNENRGFINFSSGDIAEINQQKEVAKRIIAGESFYIDGTSASMLSETGLLEKICEHLPNIKVSQSVITLLLEIKEKFNFVPGEVGHMRYGQGKLIFSPVNQEKTEFIKGNFGKCINVLEAKPENIAAISMANKVDCFSEQKIPAELCDACILAQKENIIVLTEDFLYLKVNELETKKKAPEYCSTYALMRVLYEQEKITFEQYLNYFTYLASYRFRFLHFTSEDIEKAVFGDGTIKTIQPEKIRQFNFSMTLSEEYGVPFGKAFFVVGLFFIKVLIDDTIMPEMAEKIFTEIISTFPTKKSKRVLGEAFLRFCVQVINKNQQKIIIGQKIQGKIDLLSSMLRFLDYNLQIPR